MFYFLFLAKLFPYNSSCCCLIDRVRLEANENDLQRVLIINVSAAGAASAMMNDGQLGVSQLFVCAELEL